MGWWSVIILKNRFRVKPLSRIGVKNAEFGSKTHKKPRESQ